MQGINIQTIDNGYLVAYPTGESNIVGNTQQQKVIVHYCASMQEVADYLLQMDK